MLIATGVLIALVLVVMVGQTARTMQGTGWLPITPPRSTCPYWAGLWFGVFPTWETVGAQVFAFAFVIGSYFLAQEVKVRRPRRRQAGSVRARARDRRRLRSAQPCGDRADGGDERARRRPRGVGGAA